jgi:hypothetical protein
VGVNGACTAEEGKFVAFCNGFLVNREKTMRKIHFAKSSSRTKKLT